MALVCPVDEHPPGVGTTYCRICGRDYVLVPDAPEPVAAAAPVAAPPAAPPVGSPEPSPTWGLEAMTGAPLVVAAPLVSVGAEAVVPSAPVYELPAWEPPAPAAPLDDEPVSEAAPAPEVAPVEDVAPVAEVAPEEVADEAPGKVRAAVDRNVVVLATAAGFAGGLLAGLGSHLLLG